ncbi:MAG: hypothetical protein GY953_16915 [bacterium]|nr:hypothetical protein [bacterium]
MAPGRDAFGGFSGIAGEATGYFHLQRLRGRRMLVTPAGRGFVALGVNHIGAVARPSEYDLFDQKYGRDWMRLYEDVIRQHRAWNMTVFGYGAPPEFRGRLPHFGSAGFTRASQWLTQLKGPEAFPDVFDPRFQRQVRERVRVMCRAYRDSVNLIGYFWTDTPMWNLEATRRRRGTHWVAEIRARGRDAPGKQRYVSFLRKRYANRFEALKLIYKVQADSFAALLDEDFHETDLVDPRVAADDNVFVGEIARTLYEVSGKAQRRADPNHLVFGERYLFGDHPDVVLSAAKPYIDAVSIQIGDGYVPSLPPSDQFPAAELDRLHKLTGKPILLCDNQISFPTNEYAETTWTQLPTEAAAAKATRRLIVGSMEKPYILGFIHCQYIDRISARRGAMKQGLLRRDGSPHLLLTEAIAEAYDEVQRRIAGE